jgi:hypothetical protein
MASSYREPGESREKHSLSFPAQVDSVDLKILYLYFDNDCRFCFYILSHLFDYLAMLVKQIMENKHHLQQRGKFLPPRSK